MPIKPQKPPAASLRVLRDAVGTMPPACASIARAIPDVLDHPDRHWSHPVYVVGLREMASASGLKKARVIGWRYLVRADDHRNYAIEVQQGAGRGGHRLAELDKGPFIDGLYHVLEHQDLVDAAGPPILKLAVLRISAMMIFAVWLQASTADKGVIVPIPPTPHYLKPWQTYTVKQFEDALRGEAQEDMAHPASDA